MLASGVFQLSARPSTRILPRLNEEPEEFEFLSRMDYEAAAQLIKSPMRLMERVGEYVADKIMPTPPGFSALAPTAAAPAPAPAAPKDSDVPALVSHVAEVAAATTPAKQEATTRKTDGGVTKKGAAKPKRRSPTLQVKAEPQRSLPGRSARTKAGRGFYQEANLASLA